MASKASGQPQQQAKQRPAAPTAAKANQDAPSAAAAKQPKETKQKTATASTAISGITGAGANAGVKGIGGSGIRSGTSTSGALAPSQPQTKSKALPQAAASGSGGPKTAAGVQETGAGAKTSTSSTSNKANATGCAAGQPVQPKPMPKEIVEKIPLRERLAELAMMEGEAEADCQLFAMQSHQGFNNVNASALVASTLAGMVKRGEDMLEAKHAAAAEEHRKQRRSNRNPRWLGPPDFVKALTTSSQAFDRLGHGQQAQLFKKSNKLV